MPSALLINPWIYDFAAYDLWLQPWGLMKLASLLRREDFRVDLIDLLDRHHPLLPGQADTRPDATGRYLSRELPKPLPLAGVSRRWRRYGLPLSQFEETLPGEQPDFILISSGMTYWYPGVWDAIALLRRRWPESTVILGGTYATLQPEHAAGSGADLVIGNRELERLSETMGLATTCSQQLLLEEPLCFDFHTRSPYAVLRLTQGCPFRCDYCAQHQLVTDYLQRSLETALAEIRELSGRGLRHFAWLDDALLYDRDHLHRFLEEVLTWRQTLHFHTPNGLHARFLDRETAVLLYRSGFNLPVLSLETAGATDWHAKVTVAELETAVANLRRAGYQRGEYMVYLLLGAPGFRAEALREGLELVHRLGARISLSEFSPVPGTPLGERFPEEMAEPLLQNNSIFPALTAAERAQAQEIKTEARRLNGML